MQIFTFHTVCGHDLRVLAQFGRDRLNGCDVIASFRFSIWRPSAILNLQKCANFHLSTFCVVWVTICLFVHNFVTIGWTVAELLQVFNFQYGVHSPSWICKIYKFSSSAQFEVTICKISSRSNERLWSYCKFSISNMVAVRHLGFLKYANFHLLHGLGSRSAFSCKISSGSVEWLRSYWKFSISNMAAVRHLGFLKYANFHLPHSLRSQSACSQKISSWSVERLRSYCKFSISNMVAVRHLGIFPLNYVINCPNPQKDRPCMETRRLSHEAWMSSQRFDLYVGSRKQQTKQDSQKSQKGYISPIWGEPPLNQIQQKIAWCVISMT